MAAQVAVTFSNLEVEEEKFKSKRAVDSLGVKTYDFLEATLLHKYSIISMQEAEKAMTRTRGMRDSSAR